MRLTVRQRFGAGIALLLIGLVLSADYLCDEPLRRWLVKEGNRRLTGYTVVLPNVDFSPSTLRLELDGLQIFQQRHPERAVASGHQIVISVEWRSLLRGRVVADVSIWRPDVFIDSVQLAAEDADNIAFADRGWQRLLELYPLKINAVRIAEGSLTYQDSRSKRRLELSGIELAAANIRHVDAGDQYPSPVQMTSRVFGGGRLEITGHADFLRRPHPALYAVTEIQGAPLDAFGSLVDDYRLRLSGGSLNARGQLEIRPGAYIANLQYVSLEALNVDFVATPPTPEIQRAQQAVVRAAKAADRSATLRIRAQVLRISGTLGYREPGPQGFRLFLADSDLALTNFSNQSWQGDSRLTASGRFMGSGKTRVRGVLRSGHQRGQGVPDFALDLSVVGTDLPALNGLLRAHGRLDVSDGTFSLYSQLYARNGQLHGYVKPLFTDLDVLGPEDKGDGPFQKLYEGIVEQISKLLKNRSTDEVATVTALSGNLNDPNVSAWQIVGNLLRNALVEAILPGFDHERGGKPPSVPSK